MLYWVLVSFVKKELKLGEQGGGGEDLEGHQRGEECDQRMFKIKNSFK